MGHTWQRRRCVDVNDAKHCVGACVSASQIRCPRRCESNVAIRSYGCCTNPPPSFTKGVPTERRPPTVPPARVGSFASGIPLLLIGSRRTMQEGAPDAEPLARRKVGMGDPRQRQVEKTASMIRASHPHPLRSALLGSLRSNDAGYRTPPGLSCQAGSKEPRSPPNPKVVRNTGG